MIEKVLFYAVLSASALPLGAALTHFFTVSKRQESALSHFASGVILAAVTIELLPIIAKSGAALDVALGFTCGIGAMLLLRRLIKRLETTAGSYSMPFVAAMASDFFIDGALLSIAFIAGKESGMILSLALAFELFSLGPPLTLRLQKSGFSKGSLLYFLLFLMLLVPAGALVCQGVLYLLPHGIFLATLAFGVAALLYLVTEELLLEAHETEDTAPITLSFYLGFLMVLLFT